MSAKTSVYLLLWLLATACGQTTLFESRVDFDPKGWDQDEPAVFNMNHTDTSTVVDVGMNIYHSNDYAFSNIWLFVKVDGPAGVVQTDTLEFLLAQPEGQWLGKKKGEGIQVSALYQQGVKLSKPGKYAFVIQQGMRPKQLEGIEGLSFWVQESEAKKD